MSVSCFVFLVVMCAESLPAATVLTVQADRQMEPTYSLHPSFPTGSGCGGAWGIERKIITGSTLELCFDAALADIECGDTFYFGYSVSGSGASICRCVMVGQTCDGDMGDGNWATNVYKIDDPATSTTTTEDPTQSAIGDPHLQNMYGQRFDLMRQGDFVLINIPRGKPFEDALLVVEAVARSLGGRCADMYFVNLNITGAWVDNAQAGGLSFSANSALDDKPKWAKFGPVALKVAHGRTDKGDQYLNFYVKHLGRAGFDVGGLLGSDDHTEVAMPSERCRRLLTFQGGRNPKAPNRLIASVAEATIA